jgi:peptidyl-prolyl cis-trans isomerase C
MKRCFIILSLAISGTVPLTAQEASAPAATPVPANVVATVNGEKITAEHLDRLWNRIGEKMRAQYEKTGNGKLRFLENYIGKRLLLQLAAQSDFEKSPEVQAELEAAKEAALFDLYVRDVVASQIVTEAMVRKFYDENVSQFMHPETAKVRLIQVSKAEHAVSDARALLTNIMRDLFTVRFEKKNDRQALATAFGEAAKKNSNHASASNGGDLGWVSRDALDPAIRNAVFAMAPGAMSGLLETETALNLVLVEDRLPFWTEPYESARAGIREYLFSANQQKVVEAVSRATRELRTSSDVKLYPENLK